MNIIKDMQGLLSKALRQGTTAPESLSSGLLFPYVDSLKYMIDNNILFTRRSNLNFKYLIQDPKQHHRNPLSSKNYHEFYLDHNPYWSDFPKRYNSIMFMSVRIDLEYDEDYFITLDNSVDSNYGSYCYLVIPQNHARIAISPQADMIDSFGLRHGSVYDLNNEIKRLFIADSENFSVDFSDSLNFIKNNEDFIKQCKLVDVSVSKEEFSDEFRDSIFPVCRMLFPREKEDSICNCIESIEKNGFLKMLYDRFEPNKNGFNYVDVRFVAQIPHKKECWTDSSCLMINLSHTNENELNELFNEVTS